MLFDYLKSNWCLDMSHSSFNCSSASQSYSVWLNGNTKPSIIHYRTNSSIFRVLTLDRSVNTCHPPQTVLGWPTNVAYEENAKATAFVHIFVKCAHTDMNKCVSVDIHTCSCKIPFATVTICRQNRDQDGPLQGPFTQPARTTCWKQLCFPVFFFNA